MTIKIMTVFVVLLFLGLTGLVFFAFWETNLECQQIYGQGYSLYTGNPPLCESARGELKTLPYAIQP